MAPSIAIQRSLSRERLRPQIIGILRDVDFLRLKCAHASLPFPDHYADWLDEREGLQIGLAAAGVKTILIAVDLEPFLDWCRREGAAIGDDALDRFAATTLKGVDLRAALAPVGVGRRERRGGFPAERLN